MKASEAHNLKDDELVERIRQTREEQFALRLQHATGELENTVADQRGAPRRRPAADRGEGAGDRSRTRAEGLMADEEKNEQQNEEQTRKRLPRRLRRSSPRPRRRLRPRRTPAEEEASAEEAPADQEAPPRRSRRPRRRLEESPRRGRCPGRPRLEGSSSPGALPAPGRAEGPAESRGARRRARRGAARGPPAPSAYRVKRRTKGEAGTGTPPAERRSAAARSGRAEWSPASRTRRSLSPSRSPGAIPTTRRSCAARSTLHAHDERNEAERAIWSRWSRPGPFPAPSAGACSRSWRRRSDARDPAGVKAQGRRQLGRARDPLHPRQGRVRSPLRADRRRDHRDREAGDPARRRSQGRGGRGRRCPHPQAARARDGTYIAFDENAAVLIDTTAPRAAPASSGRSPGSSARGTSCESSPSPRRSSDGARRCGSARTTT